MHALVNVKHRDHLQPLEDAVLVRLYAVLFLKVPEVSEALPDVASVGVFVHPEVLVLIYHQKHGFCGHRVKYRAYAALYLGTNLLLRLWLTVGAGGGHRVVAVGNADYPCLFRDLLALQPVRIAISAIPFVMGPCPLCKGGHISDIPKDLIALDRMLLDLRKLIICKL